MGHMVTSVWQGITGRKDACFCILAFRRMLHTAKLEEAVLCALLTWMVTTILEAQNHWTPKRLTNVLRPVPNTPSRRRERRPGLVVR